MGSAATHAINSSLYKSLPYDHIKDFAPITLIAQVPNILVVNPSVSVKSVKVTLNLPHSTSSAPSSTANGTTPCFQINPKSSHFILA